MMARKPLDLPMQWSESSRKDMRAYHAEPNTMKRVEIAEGQFEALQEFVGPQDKKLELRNIIELFEEIKHLR